MESAAGSSASALQHLEAEVRQRDLELNDLKGELEKETAAYERVRRQNREHFTEFTKLRREKDRRLDEVAKLKRQIDSQTESYGSVLSGKDSELQRCQGAANLLRAYSESLGAERQLLAQIMEVTAQTMNRLAGIHEQSRITIQRLDRVIGELCERTNGNILQVQQLIRRREELDEEDRNFRRFLDAQVEEWQTRLEPIDKTLEEYGRTVRSLEDELKIAGKEEDDLRQILQERDASIENLKEDINRHSQKAQEFLFQAEMRKLQKDKEHNRMKQLQSRQRNLQSRLERAERRARRADSNYLRKKRELEASRQILREYELAQSERETIRRRFLQIFCCCIQKR